MQNSLSTEPTKKKPTIEEIKQKWESSVIGYSFIPSYTTRNLALNFINLMKIPDVENILEMGCGNGDFAVEIITSKNPSATYQTFDLADAFLSETITKLTHLESNYKENYQQALNDIKTNRIEKITHRKYEGDVVKFENLNTKIGIGNAEELNTEIYPDNFYDVVLSNHVLHLVTNTESMLKEAFRVLAPGGRAAFTVWGPKEGSEYFTVFENCLMKFERFKEIIEKTNARSPWHLNDRNKVLNTMETIGFKDCKSIELFTFFDFSSGDKQKEQLKKHVVYELRDIPKSLDGSEKDQQLFEEVIEMIIKEFTRILVDERRILGYKNYMYYGDK